MAKDDHLPPICRTCRGEGGEWISKDGKEVWLTCTPCGGVGRQPPT
nr:hypothetical protein [Herbidospora sakaeratensis]